MNILENVEKLSPKKGDLLTINVPLLLKHGQRESLEANLRPVAERLGCELLVLECGITAQIHPSLGDLLAEQQKQTALLEQIATQNLALLEALADDTAIDPGDRPRTHYLDGSPVLGGR
jgi:hypothetical protein